MLSNTRSKIIAAVTAVSLVVTPAGLYGSMAFGEGSENLSAAASSGDLSAFPEEVRTAINYYSAGNSSAAEVKGVLASLANSGIIDSTQLSVLTSLIDQGMFAPAVEPSTDEGTTDGSAGEDNSGGGGEEGSGEGEGAGEGSDGTESAGGTDGSGDASDAGDVSPDADNNGADSADPAAEAGSQDTPATPADETAAQAGTDENATADESSENTSTSSTPDSGTYTSVIRTTQNLTTVKFIALIGEQARQIGQDYNIYASVMIAQAILESASGNSVLAQAPNNNLFGIKGSWRGNSISMSTKEDNGSGVLYTEIAAFRKYDSVTDSMEDYALLLTNSMSSTYRGAWKSNAATYAEACEWLQGRYATDTSYAAKLKGIIEAYDLTRYDEPLGYEFDEAIEVQAQDATTGEALTDEQGNPVMEKLTIADLLACATSQLGIEYVWGGSSPDEGFDCSGLVQYAYKTALGVSLPRTSQQQWKVGEVVQFDELQPGDLLFFEENGDVHHVAIYLGEGCYLHAPTTGDVVKVTTLDEYTPSFAVRILPTHEVGQEVEVVAEESQEVIDYAELAAYMNVLGL